MAGNKLVIGLAAGALIGAAAGLLMAPKSGSESRQIVGSKAGSIQNGARSYFSNVRGWVRRSSQDAAEEEANATVNGVVS